MNEYDEMPIEVVAEEIEARDEAEKAGLYDQVMMTNEQFATLHAAMSSLLDLAKETDSSLSDLIRMYGKVA